MPTITALQVKAVLPSGTFNIFLDWLDEHPDTEVGFRRGLGSTALWGWAVREAIRDGEELTIECEAVQEFLSRKHP